MSPQNITITCVVEYRWIHSCRVYENTLDPIPNVKDYSLNGTNMGFDHGRIDRSYGGILLQIFQCN
jgi:hypothetical protein